MGLQVINREGVELGTVTDLMATGPNTVLVLQWQAQGQTLERMIPFVNAYIDSVDLKARRILVDWQPDY
jgi:16S rRNA processing protein RimM